MAKSTKISMTMRYKLHAIASTTLGQEKGATRFISGFPTYEALERRGLVKLDIEHRTGRGVGWIVRLTEAGWKAIGKEKPE